MRSICFFSPFAKLCDVGHPHERGRVVSKPLAVRGTLGILAGLAKTLPLPPERDVPIPGLEIRTVPLQARGSRCGDQGAPLGQPNSRAVERQASLLPLPPASGEEERPAFPDPSPFLPGLDLPGGLAVFLRRRRGKARPRPPRKTFASSLWTFHAARMPS